MDTSNDARVDIGGLQGRQRKAECTHECNIVQAMVTHNFQGTCKTWSGCRREFDTSCGRSVCLYLQRRMRAGMTRG
eukprot:1136777-Pelagomonas_calceolata.AAC.2